MAAKHSPIRRAFTIQGQVQGVGFRPFVWRLAAEEQLTGAVGNTADGVRIEIQGSEASIARFAHRLTTELPPLARIVGIASVDLPIADDTRGFAIVPSSGCGGHNVLVSPDMGICPDCLADMRDPENPRHGYPFTNCTNCGPRYTITRSIPYDRRATTMACFPMCDRCDKEYRSPADRRFHAQPIACPNCGPRLWYISAGDIQNGAHTGPERAAKVTESLQQACRLLRDGKILALRGLGGFQLACDARNAPSLRLLRKRKQRPHKPLALMLPDIATAKQICRLSPEHEALLQSPEKPIVLCTRSPRCTLPCEIAPDMNTIGLMLPNTPLHAALFDQLAQYPDWGRPILVMTSANPAGEPICLGNREALSRLRGLADGWLLHDRDILTRVDDSVLAPAPNKNGIIFYRRARGYVPSPVFLPNPAPTVLGVGAELKATACLTRNKEAFVGQHIGDLENAASMTFHEQTIQHLEGLLAVRPAAIACDLHPDFPSTRYAEERAASEGLPLFRLQHHAAHAASALAENGCYTPALALCLDGTGLGTDGGIWGGELLWMHLECAQWRRLGRLAPFPLPGGEMAIRQPWRIALGLRRQAGVTAAMQPWEPDSAFAGKAIAEMLDSHCNTPMTSSCGRLFDAVSAQLGICLATTYEGQAAIRLEAACSAQGGTPWDAPVSYNDGLWEIDSAAIFCQVLAEQAHGQPAGVIAAHFHHTLAKAFAHMAAEAARDCGASQVALTGGVMQNRILARLLPQFLRQHGLAPLTQHDLPPGDGGLSLGQAVWGQQCLLKKM